MRSFCAVFALLAGCPAQAPEAAAQDYFNAEDSGEFAKLWTLLSAADHEAMSRAEFVELREKTARVAKALKAASRRVVKVEHLVRVHYEVLGPDPAPMQYAVAVASRDDDPDRVMLKRLEERLEREPPPTIESERRLTMTLEDGQWRAVLGLEHVKEIHAFSQDPANAYEIERSYEQLTCLQGTQDPEQMRRMKASFYDGLGMQEPGASELPTPPTSTHVDFDFRSHIRKLDDFRYAVDRAAVAKIFGILVFRLDGRRVPSFEGGKVSGFKLFALRPEGVYPALGFQNGDIVRTINGHSIASPEEAFRIWETVQGAQKIGVEIQRRGTRKTLVFEVN